MGYEILSGCFVLLSGMRMKYIFEFGVSLSCGLLAVGLVFIVELLLGNKSVSWLGFGDVDYWFAYVSPILGRYKGCNSISYHEWRWNIIR